jgi:hypothetical protein
MLDEVRRMRFAPHHPRKLLMPLVFVPSAPAR